jgi:hypothetical protein
MNPQQYPQPQQPQVPSQVPSEDFLPQQQTPQQPVLPLQQSAPQSFIPEQPTPQNFNPMNAVAGAAVPPVMPTAAGKSKVGLIIGLIGGVVLLLVIVLVLGWFILWSPAAQSKRLSSAFMHSITTGDVTKAVDLTGDSTAKDFLTNASPKVHGSYSLSQSKFADGKGYYLYTLDGATDKYARTIIEKDSGKRVVNSFVFSNETLALVPSSSTASTTSATSTTDTAQSAPASSSTSGCLTPTDFSFFSNVGAGSPTANGNGTYSVFFQLEFDSDVATYTAGGNPDPTTVFNDFKNFYAQDASKKYVIELESSVNSATPDESLADARNNKVQSDLESISGIPASQIAIQPITNDTSDTTAGDAFFRQVQITLTSADSCSTPS